MEMCAILNSLSLSNDMKTSTRHTNSESFISSSGHRCWPELRFPASRLDLHSTRVTHALCSHDSVCYVKLAGEAWALQIHNVQSVGWSCGPRALRLKFWHSPTLTLKQICIENLFHSFSADLGSDSLRHTETKVCLIQRPLSLLKVSEQLTVVLWAHSEPLDCLWIDRHFIFEVMWGWPIINLFRSSLIIHL